MTEHDRIEGMATLAAKACMTDVGNRLRSAILTDGLVTACSPPPSKTPTSNERSHAA